MVRFRCINECCAGQEGLFWAPTRRHLLKSGLAAAAVSALPQQSVYAKPAGAVYQDFWYRPRVLRMYRAETGESGNFEYWRDGQYQLDAWYQILRLLRDVQQNVEMHYDPKVVNLVWAVQEWVMLDQGKRLTYRLTDGARTEVTNRRTKGAAPLSEHKNGKAIDGRFEGLGLRAYANAARFFGIGGVGLYSTHVHVDSASVRQWGM